MLGLKSIYVSKRGHCVLNPCSWMTWTYECCLVNIKAADGLTTQWAKTPSAMILTVFRNNPGFAWQGIKLGGQSNIFMIFSHQRNTLFFKPCELGHEITACSLVLLIRRLKATSNENTLILTDGIWYYSKSINVHKNVTEKWPKVVNCINKRSD